MHITQACSTDDLLHFSIMYHLLYLVAEYFVPTVCNHVGWGTLQKAETSKGLEPLLDVEKVKDETRKEK